MIQRIQSLWLLLAAACAAASFRFPFYSGTSPKGLSPYELKAGENILLLSLTLAVGALALYALVMFKKRTLQLRLCLLGILLEALLLYFYYRETGSYSKGTYSLTSILHPIILLSFILAARGIYNDQKLVRNSDRLR